MNATSHRVLGLMSGTSLDGLDLCFAKFSESKTKKWAYKILAAETLPYDAVWEEKLRTAIDLPAEKLLALHSEYGFYLAERVKKFIEDHQLESVSLIASHGHTVFHQPEKKFTFQLGDARAIRLRTGIPTVYDFRSENLLRGGQGAPLVPLGDRFLFGDYEACLNLGGFSNISLEHRGSRVAFDISPVNIVLNALARKLGFPFDKDGALARKGVLNEEILEDLNSRSYYQETYPKSLGVEWVDGHIWPLLQHMPPLDALRTFTEHTAEQMATILQKFNLKNVLLTGGGVFNHFLIERLQAKTAAQLVIPEDVVINFKEALIFAFLGLRAYRGEYNILASATGCDQDHIGGTMAL